VSDGIPDGLLAEDITRCLRTHGELSTRQLFLRVRKGNLDEGYGWNVMHRVVKQLAATGRLVVRHGKNRALVYDVARGDPDEAEAGVADPKPVFSWEKDAEPCCPGWGDDTYFGPTRDGHSPGCTRMPPTRPSNTRTETKAAKPTRTRPPRLRVVPEPAQLVEEYGGARCSKVECGKPCEPGQLWCDPCARLSRQQLGLGG